MITKMITKMTRRNAVIPERVKGRQLQLTLHPSSQINVFDYNAASQSRRKSGKWEQLLHLRKQIVEIAAS
eukprot:10774302-Karenia_brevis.AAC.1